MKKFTALMLVVLMVVALVPFSASAATAWTKVDTAEEFAAMKDGNYWLTADIDLSKVTWTTIAEFSGTLNGNGKTVTVPKDAPIFEKLSGTVKNVNLKGAMTLDSADASKVVPTADVKGGGIGALANYAFGASVENVHVNVDLTYEGGIANIGGIVGNAMSEYTITEGKTNGNLTFGDHTTIKNCTVAGTWSITYSAAQKSAIGGIVGCAYGNTVIDTCAVTVKATVVNSTGQNGGFVGSCYGDSYRTASNAKLDNYNDVLRPTEVKNCFFGGDFEFKSTVDNAQVDQTATMVGYARGLTMTNCFSNGTWITRSTNNDNKAGGTAHIFAYCNTAASVWCNVTIDGCASISKVEAYKKDGSGGAVNTAISGKTTGIFVKNNLLVTGQTISVNGKGDLNDTLDPQQAINNVVVGDAAAVTAKFVENNASFKLESDKVVLVQPTFTPEADPADPTPAPTGDMTIALVAVAVVALAAVTVITKKKVTE